MGAVVLRMVVRHEHQAPGVPGPLLQAAAAVAFRPIAFRPIVPEFLLREIVREISRKIVREIIPEMDMSLLLREMDMLSEICCRRIVRKARGAWRRAGRGAQHQAAGGALRGQARGRAKAAQEMSIVSPEPECGGTTHAVVANKFGQRKRAFQAPVQAFPRSHSSGFQSAVAVESGVRFDNAFFKSYRDNLASTKPTMVDPLIQISSEALPAFVLCVARHFQAVRSSPGEVRRLSEWLRNAAHILENEFPVGERRDTPELERAALELCRLTARAWAPRRKGYKRAAVKTKSSTSTEDTAYQMESTSEQRVQVEHRRLRL